MTDMEEFRNENLRVTFEVITPEMAADYLKANVSNRKLRPAEVSRYTKFLNDGNFKFNPADNIVFDEGGRLINGQHRLAAIVKSGKSMPCLVVRGAESESFQIMDCGLQRRISDVIYSADGIKNAARVAGIINKYFLLKNDIIATFCSTTGQRNTKGIPREEFLHEYHSDEEFYQRVALFGEHHARKIRVMTCNDIGGIYVFLVKAKFHREEKVRQFFHELCIPDLSEDTPPTVLYKILRDDKLNKDKKLTHERRQSIIAAAWNAFLLNKRLPHTIAKSDNIVKFL